MAFFQVDRLFDLLNCHNPFGKGYKSPLTRSNFQSKEEIIKQSMDYFNSLELLNGKPIRTSRRKAFVIGFETAATSFLRLGKYIFDKFPNTKYLLAYKLGQDHIETLFSKIRSKGGFNNNPNIVAFKSALKSVLVKSDITANPNGNCIELEEGSTGTDSLLLISINKKRAKPRETTEEQEEEIDFADDNFQLEMQLSKPIVDIVEYIGGSIFFNNSRCLRQPETI